MRAGAELDAVVVGASIAGCTAARLLALGGARVALVERRSDALAHKVVCTHNILSSATPTIERLGLGRSLEARGALRTLPRAWSSHGGWIDFPSDSPRGFAVTRRTLDPMLRELAASTPGVELLLGHAVTGLRRAGERVAGVDLTKRDGTSRSIRAPLVVGADGRGSSVARLAALRGRVRPNRRFFYFAYWRGVEPAITASQLCFLDPDVGAAFPAEDGLTVLAVVPHRSRLAAFKSDREARYLEAVRGLPGIGDLSGAERASKLIGALDVPNVIRPPIRPGLALVGDAAITSDPVFGVGCGWAFQGAEWLAELAAGALLGGGDLDRALARYRRALWLRLIPHHLQIAAFSSGRRLRPQERLAFRTAATDPEVARAIDDFMSRRRGPLRLLDPLLAGRVARAAASRARGASSETSSLGDWLSGPA